MQNKISSSSSVDAQQAAARRNPSGGLRGRSDKRDVPTLKSSELIANDRKCAEQSCFCSSERQWCSCGVQIYCIHYDLFALGCSSWHMACTTMIKCSGRVINGTTMLYICRYNDAKTGNIELIPINDKCGRIICMPGTTLPPTTPLIPTRPVTDAGCGGPAAKPMVLGLYEFSMSVFII